jgi:hypothetical protein
VTGADRIDCDNLEDVLWAAMLRVPEVETSGAGWSHLWRRHIYGGVERRCRSRIQSHRNPEPWLSLKCGLQFTSGDGWRRDQRRYEGLEGGAATEREYQLLRNGQFSLPILLVGGYPRSGTTALQTIVRAAFPAHVPEIETVDERFSLWEYPKHTSSVLAALGQMNEAIVIGLCAVRPFVDSAASLVVGRGGREHVDVSAEARLWEAWLPVYEAAAIRVLAFETLRSLEPAQLLSTVAVITGVAPEVSMSADATYAQLMREMGKGDPDHPRQSNLPSASRTELLAEARAWVVGELGQRECARLDDIYSRIPFSIDPAGTVEPR